MIFQSPTQFNDGGQYSQASLARFSSAKCLVMIQGERYQSRKAIPNAGNNPLGKQETLKGMGTFCKTQNTMSTDLH